MPGSSSNKFSTALWARYHSGRMPVIADIKCKSPGEGDLLKGRNPVTLAGDLAAAGAAAISVVTEPMHFGGSKELLQQIAVATSLPVLRKDFIHSQAQLKESVDLGASAILLIASMLEKKRLVELVEDALALNLEPLVETHNESEIAFINQLKLTAVGINNRNIVDLERDDGNVSNTERLAGYMKPEVLLVCESSIASPMDVQRAMKAGAHAVLVGTTILKAENPVEMYHRLSEVGVEYR